MEAQVWTLIALLGGSLMSMLLYLGGRIDRNEARFDRVDERFDRVDERFDRMDVRFERLEDQGRRLGDQFYEVAIKLDEHLRRHAS